VYENIDDILAHATEPLNGLHSYRGYVCSMHHLCRPTNILKTVLLPRP